MSTKYIKKVENKTKVVSRLFGVKEDKSPKLFSQSKSSSKSSFFY
jgi:hypothetical protein